MNHRYSHVTDTSKYCYMHHYLEVTVIIIPTPRSHDLIMKHIFGTDLNVYYFNNFPSLDNFISIKLPSLAKKKKKRGKSEHQRSKPTEQTRKLRDGFVHVWKLNI